MENLRQLVLKEHSKAHALVIADIVRQKPELLDELLDLTFANEEPISRRASWPLRLLYEQWPLLLSNKIVFIINQLETIKSTAVLRNMLALLIKVPIPEDKKTYLLDFCALTILNPQSAIAVVAHASDLFIKIAGNEIELLYELQLMLEQNSVRQSGGIQAKIHLLNKHLKKLNR